MSASLRTGAEQEMEEIKTLAQSLREQRDRFRDAALEAADALRVIRASLQTIRLTHSEPFDLTALQRMTVRTIDSVENDLGDAWEAMNDSGPSEQLHLADPPRELH